MKTRKIFLDGYVELVPRLFRKKKTINAVSVNSKNNFIGFSKGIMATANVKIGNGEKLNATIAIHNSKDKFIVIFEEEGKFAMRRYSPSYNRIVNAGLVDSLIQCGFENKKYKATSPEQGVIVVTKEEAV